MKLSQFILLLFALAMHAPSAGAQEQAFFLSERERAAIDDALVRGSTWLHEQRVESGAWQASRANGVDPVALTAMAVWAGAETGDARDEAAVEYLLRYRQEDGGLYAKERGLRVYTSGVAARALGAVNERWPDEELQRAVQSVGLYAYRGQVPESFVDDAVESVVRSAVHAKRAAALLVNDELSANERTALEFLAHLEGADAASSRPNRTRDPAWKLPEPEEQALSYEDVLPLVYAELRADHRNARRAREALRNWFALDVNPDLTRRWTSSGFHQPEQGLYYYYLTTARVLTAFQAPHLTMADGTTRYWPRELSRQLMKLQHEDGSWRNSTSRWWEGEPVLTTSYALLALKRCRDAPPDRRKR